VTDTRCCRYSCLCSWWWVMVPPKTCRTVSRYNKLCNVASYWIYIRILLRSTDPRTLKTLNENGSFSIWSIVHSLVMTHGLVIENVLLYSKTSIIWSAQILTVCTLANRTVPISSLSSQMSSTIFAPRSFALWKVNVCLYKVTSSYFHCARVSTSVTTRFNILCKLQITMWQHNTKVQYH